MFYDFTCGLEQYCLNREPGYFKNTRFYHHIFHSYSHGCSALYSCKELIGFRGINASICEQLNSFLQCVKSLSKHVSEHFMFFMQCMVQIWNYKKKFEFEWNSLLLSLEQINMNSIGRVAKLFNESCKLW